MKSSLYLYFCFGDTKSQVSVHTKVRTLPVCYRARFTLCYKRKSAVCYSYYFLEKAKFLTYLSDATEVKLAGAAVHKVLGESCESM